MIERCRAIYRYLRQPAKAFSCCLWFIILLWMVINLGVAFGFYDWDDAMLEERMYLKEDSARQKKHIQALQDYITDHANHTGPSFE